MSPGELFLLPAAWPVLLAAPLVWLELRAFDRARAGRLARVVGPRAGALTAELGRRRRRARSHLFAASLLLALVAVLQPLVGEGVGRIEQRGVDLVVALDVSRSMLARDLPPSRLARAKHELRALAERARGDRLGLVLFAGGARLAVPLTRDLASFADLADLADPTSVERGGTDLGAALALSQKALGDSSGEHEAILLLTDGEDLEGRGLAVARRCGERGIPVHCVGFGTPRGSKIAIEEEAGETFLRDRAGNEVVSALDPASLRAMAAAAGGEYIDAAALPLPLVELYEKRIVPMSRKALERGERRERENRYQWPLLAAFLLWIAELGLADRRKTGPAAPGSAPARRPSVLGSRRSRP